MLEVKNRIPNNRIDFIWNTSQDILGTKVAKPCTCGSAAGYWRDAVNTINEYLEDK